MAGNGQTSLGEDFGPVGSDSADQASANVYREVEGSVRTAISNVRSGTASRIKCVLCNAKIPLARRKGVKGVQTCVECQKQVESGAVALSTIENADVWERAEDRSDDEDVPEVEV